MIAQREKMLQLRENLLAVEEDRAMVKAQVKRLAFLLLFFL